MVCDDAEDSAGRLLGADGLDLAELGRDACKEVLQLVLPTGLRLRLRQRLGSAWTGYAEPEAIEPNFTSPSSVLQLDGT
jgi:hypothetical protein